VAVLAICDGLVWAETGRGDAGVGWVVSLFERDLRAAEAGTADFVLFIWQISFSAAAFDCFGNAWGCRSMRHFSGQGWSGYGHNEL